jgi:CDP-glycerol glycerophosphotransferase
MPDSLGYLEALGRARYVVANHGLPGYFRKRPGTTYLQTWHGTPLKRIAFDIERPAFKRTRRDLRRLRRDIAAWDFLISPNRFSTEVFRQAFHYDGRIIETGYPRNDVLSSPDAAQAAAEIRRRLGVSGDARVILYAPTWRDDESFSLELDLEQLLGQAARDWVVLLRAHVRVADTVAVSDGSRVLNVSRYPDIRDLYLAADVLVTDYSSAMFDFAVTRKPMLFYTYDLAHYRDELRGFYLDFEREVPGPLLMTTGEVVDALAQLDDVVRDHAEAYERFLQRFCYLEDGHASDRVIDAVFTT